MNRDLDMVMGMRAFAANVLIAPLGTLMDQREQGPDGQLHPVGLDLGFQSKNLRLLKPPKVSGLAGGEKGSIEVPAD